MDRYQRVEKPREDTPINENEIRITTLGRMRNYITYATSLLQEKSSNEIVLKAMGRAINKTVMIVELIKRRIVDLHQNTVIGSTDITDTWEPLEEGLLPLETTRHVSVISITLSKTELDISAVGYQPPLPRDQVKPLAEFNYEGEDTPSGRERGRGGRGRGRARGNRPSNYNDGNWDNRGRGFARGAYGRSRGRSYRGRGRGGYGGQPDYQQENSGYTYNDEAPIRNRGRGGYGGQPDYQQENSGYAYNDEAPIRNRGRGGYGGQPDYQQENSGYAHNDEAPTPNRGRGGYGGRPDYQQENSGYAHNDEAPTPNRGRGGYGGRPDYQQENSGYAYNDEAPIRNRGRARGRGRGPARGRGGNSRPNGLIHESTVARA